MQINLSKFKNTNSTVFTGRPQGEEVRNQLDLDKLDSNNETIEVVIPEDTTSINPSFFLGLFYKSFEKLKDDFIDKYIFIYETNDLDIKNILKRNIDDAIRNAYNSLNSKKNLKNLFGL